jgi:hypothetical protein
MRIVIALLALYSFGDVPPAGAAASTEISASQQINRLLKAFAGDWKTTEAMEHSELFPNGGARQGVATFRLGTGGTTLIEEGRSDGSAGPLEFLIVIWWDEEAGLYRLLTCFNGYAKPCELRGTARWEGDTFVNDYQELVGAKSTMFRDAFSEITPSSFTLVASIASPDGALRPLITTRYVRTRPQVTSE